MKLEKLEWERHTSDNNQTYLEIYRIKCAPYVENPPSHSIIQ